MPASAALRRLVLAASLLHGVDVDASDAGAVLDGWGTALPWALVARAADAGDAAADSASTAASFAAQLLALQAAAALVARSTEGLLSAMRPLGRPTGAVDHPGRAWVHRTVPGGALDLGLALAPLVAPGSAPTARARPPLPLTPWVFEALRSRGALPAPPDLARPAWGYLHRMGALAAARLAAGDRVLRPLGDCDVVTLLGSRALREAVADEDGTGMRGVAVPMRTRGWVDLTGVDPAFAVAAAAATDPADRGFDGPLLVTADEVVLARMSARPAELALRGAVRIPAPRR